MSAAADDGFTLVEMLVSLSLAAFITSFAIVGLTTSMRVMSSFRAYEDTDSDYTAMSRVRSLVAASRTATIIDPELGVAKLLFSGRPQSLDFVTLSEGYALEGGPVRVNLSLNCVNATADSCALEMRTEVYRPDLSYEIKTDPVIVIGEVKDFHLSYFGKESDSKDVSWLASWVSTETLPKAVRIQVAKERNGTVEQFTTIVPVRSASAR